MTTIGYITSMISWIGFFTAIFLSYYHYLKFRNRERTLLIEKNIDVTAIFKNQKSKFPWFMVGYTILGSSLGTLMSVLVFVNGLKMGSEGGIDILITATTFLFGAVGMIIGKNVEIKKN